MSYTRILAVLMFAAVCSVQAAEPDSDALFLQQQVRNNTGFVDSYRTSTLIIKDRNGRETRRELGISTLESADGYHKTLISVLAPDDLKGTAILSHPGPAAQQWVYLPALKRVTKVNFENRTGAFLGSEFTYEDIGLSSYQDYTNTYVRADMYNGMPCHIIESVPHDSHSGYSKLVYWIEQSTLFNHKIDYYDKQGGLQKTLSMDKWSMYSDSFAVVKDMYMVNHQTGAQSELHVSYANVGNDYALEDFKPARIQRTQ